MNLEALQTIVLLINTVGLLWVFQTVSSSKKTRLKGALILDSCALIDGRILEVVQSGLINDTLVIPDFILSELQLLADGRDNHKRARARYGLEVANTLKRTYENKLVVYTTKHDDYKTDDKLIALAKKLSARICTTDYNLNKVASVQGTSVLNMNELAQSIRTIVLPGEEQSVKIIQKGEGNTQGIGYLADGTLVVVEGARKFIGTTQTVVIDRSLQTIAGKMCFAKIKAKR